MINAAVVGGAGYVGGELIRLLIQHPDCQLVSVSSRSQDGKLVSEVHKDLLGWTDLRFTSDYDLDADVVFISMGHGKSKGYLEKATLNDNVAVIDLSRDYRLKDTAEGFIYGLPELNKASIKQSNRIANPGCFATCIQLALLPLAANGILNNEVHVTAITGSTGAGQKPVATTHFSWRNSNLSVYKAFTHQHLDEINQSLNQLQPDFGQQVNFIPMRGDFTRGIFASVYLDSELTEDQARKKYIDFYQSSPFVHVSNESIAVKEVVNTNNGKLYIEKQGSKLRIESAIDNLLKGAAGQAVQNMNLMFGLDEVAGLRLKASSF